MNDSQPQAVRAAYIPAPRHPDLVALHGYWLAQAGARAMPARSDIDPAAIKPLLPVVMLYDVQGPGRYRMRLIGERVVQFVGRNMTGEDATTGMDQDAAAAMREILDAVVATGSPRFRAGKAWWWRDKSFCDFEACFMPLATDGRTVTMILAGATFAV